MVQCGVVSGKTSRLAIVSTGVSRNIGSGRVVGIDREARESIDARALLVFLKENQVNKTIGNCARLVKYFDSDGDGELSFADFIQMVLPCDDNLMRAQVQKRPYSRVGRFDSLPFDLESGLVKLIQHELDFQRMPKIGWIMGGWVGGWARRVGK